MRSGILLNGNKNKQFRNILNACNALYEYSMKVPTALNDRKFCDVPDACNAIN